MAAVADPPWRTGTWTETAWAEGVWGVSDTFTPDATRVFTVRRESRTFAVAAESRVFRVAG